MADNWSIKYVISDFLGGGVTLSPTPRKEIWASDLGKPYFDTYNKMIGTPYTNPTDGHGMITFLLGKAMEDGIYKMLTSVGLAFESQERLVIETEGNLNVVGRPDLILCIKDWDEVIKNIEKLDPKEYRLEGLKRIVERYKEQYPEGLKETPFEIKSINSNALRYNKVKGMANAYPFHHLQLFTYMKAKGYKEGHLLYLAKDTGYMEEVIVKWTPELEAKWLKEVSNISKYYQSNTMPEFEPSTIDGKKNWLVDYSNYKDLIKSLETQKEAEIPEIIQI